MAKQTRLEKEGFDRRKVLDALKDYRRKVNEYSARHKDAISDGDPQGKGNNTSLGMPDLPGVSTSKGISYKVMDTKSGNGHATIGGQYDIYGRNGVGGRKYLQSINLYGPTYEYGLNLIDTSANHQAGQYHV